MRACLLAVAFVSAAEAAPPSIAASGNRSMAVKSDGTVWAWGRDSGATPSRIRALPAPRNPGVRVPKALDLVVQVASHGSRALALRMDGSVWQWENRESPVRVPGLSGIDAVAVGRRHNLALDQQGLVWIWEGNAIPVRVPRLRDVVAIATGNDHNLALTSDGRVWAWRGAAAVTAVRAADGRDFNLLR